MTSLRLVINTTKGRAMKQNQYHLRHLTNSNLKVNFGVINRTHKKESGYEKEFWMDESKVKKYIKNFG